jgi:hypothetical protein
MSAFGVPGRLSLFVQIFGLPFSYLLWSCRIALRLHLLC